MLKMLKQYIKFLETKYYHWRYWNNLYRNMLKQTGRYKRRTNNEFIPYINKPGIAFSFDDSYRVHDWYNYGKSMFGYYDIKVTFNINGTHPLESSREHTQQEIDKLIELQSNGHEIGHHGFRHQKAPDYAAKNGYDKWVEDEIETLINWMDKKSHSKTKEKFKKPVSFAFPHFIYDDDTIKKLIPNYFSIARGHIKKDNLTPFNFIGLAPSICLDSYYSFNMYYIKKILKLTKKTGKNLILTCHSILPENVKIQHCDQDGKATKWGTWRISPMEIQAIIHEARKNDLEFYTTSEIAGIATFLDSNLENTIRECILTTSKWIKISELMEIKDLDLSNKGISNLDGLQYFTNLEKINLSNNNITDIRILKKLPKIKYINIDNNPIIQKEKIIVTS